MGQIRIIFFFRKARAKQQRGENYKALDAEDEVRLYEDGWKDRYFRSKFDVSADDTEFRRKVVEKYTEGLCWVLSYYYQGQDSKFYLPGHRVIETVYNRTSRRCKILFKGVQDWSWYFPFHYAPFASDFTDLSSIEIKWDRSARPRKPLEQLMCVFPAASGQVILSKS